MKMQAEPPNPPKTPIFAITHHQMIPTFHQISSTTIPGGQRILHASIALNNTYLLLQQRGQEKEEISVLVHHGEKGQILWQMVLKCRVERFSMRKDSDVALFDVSRRVVVMVDLRQYEVREVPCPFGFRGFHKISLQTFGESNLILLVCAHQQKGVQLFYYPYDSFRHKCQPVCYVKNAFQGYTHQHKICKIDELSGVACWPSIIRANEPFRCEIYRLEIKSGQGSKQTIVAAETLASIFTVHEESYPVASITQTATNQLLIHAALQTSIAVSYRPQDQTRPLFHGWFKITTLHQTPSLSYGHLLPPANRWGNLGGIPTYLHQLYGIGKYTIFQLISHLEQFTEEEGITVKQIEYYQYVDHQNELKFAQFDKRKYMVTAFFPTQWNPRRSIGIQQPRRASWHPNLGDMNVKVEIREFCEKKDVHMWMLLGCQEDFDDDLLMDAVEMLAE